MTHTDHGFYFEKAGRSATQGAIAPAEQFFEGSAAEVSLARELGQNSLDAVSGEWPVRMRFELGELSTAEIPGVDELRHHIEWVADATEGKQGHQRMLEAAELIAGESLPVLVVSDFGTKGLGGSESVADNGSPLSALTRGAGVSANDGSRGGSFGIGSAVGPMSSGISTVLYTSLPVGGDQVVFAGHSRLATHTDGNGVLRQGDGFFTDRAVTDDFAYLRNPAPLGPFEQRTAPGTDLYILGYRKALDDPALEHIRDAFVENFLAAIAQGRLVVEGVTPSGEWTLDQASLPGYVR